MAGNRLDLGGFNPEPGEWLLDPGMMKAVLAWEEHVCWPDEGLGLINSTQKCELKLNTSSECISSTKAVPHRLP